MKAPDTSPSATPLLAAALNRSPQPVVVQRRRKAWRANPRADTISTYESRDCSCSSFALGHRALPARCWRHPRGVGCPRQGDPDQRSGRGDPPPRLGHRPPGGDPPRNGRLAELFLHTVADIPEFFEWDRARRRGTVLFIYDRGLPLTDPYGHVARTRELAREVLAGGHPPLTPAEWRHGRYVLTCYLDDLVDTPPASRYEQLSLADHTLREAAHLVTAHHRAWTGIGKWLPRRLLSADATLGKSLLDGHQAVAERADATPLATAAQQVLDLIGGPLREGHAHRWPT